MQQTPTPPPDPAQQFGKGLGEFIASQVNGALQAARAELQAELDAQIQIRNDMQAQLASTTSSSTRRILQSRIDQANAHIAEISDKIAKLGTRTATKYTGTPQAGTAPPPDFPRGRSNDPPSDLILGSLGIVFVAFPLSIAMARWVWKRTASGPASAAAQQLPAETTRRFDRLEQSVDAIAIEIERISENQRYLTKVMAEGDKKLTG